ncbi:unnamed protein product [Oppiella nova]|uniref:Uncharacterized protein n=1 Tax=Oppiella nova TaxID=334625 RepID=A0A7R9M6J7_9ACAR|nr:unnamed protein product [Oppiella nova]CAG2171721.1 unnamed protein product [Oppiella nova]
MKMFSLVIGSLLTMYQIGSSTGFSMCLLNTIGINCKNMTHDEQQDALIENLLTRVKNRANDLVPIGFIYTQHPDQAEPGELWPGYTWADVTGQYAGLFFRAEGGSSLPFNGGAQGEDAPSVDEPYWVEYFKVKVSGGEVRPKNQAIRIWERVK